MKIEIRNIHTSDRYPGIVYATLYDADTDEMIISATLDYIVDEIKSGRFTIREANGGVL